MLALIDLNHLFLRARSHNQDAKFPLASFLNILDAILAPESATDDLTRFRLELLYHLVETQVKYEANEIGRVKAPLSNTRLRNSQITRRMSSFKELFHG